jgi:hypothetical protein
VVLVGPLAALKGRGGGLSSRGIEAGRVVGGMGDAVLEESLPLGRSGVGLFWSGWSVVVRVDRVGGPPHLDFTDKAGRHRTARRDPHGLGVVAEGVVSDVVGEVGDQSGSLGQVVTQSELS